MQVDTPTSSRESVHPRRAAAPQRDLEPQLAIPLSPAKAIPPGGLSRPPPLSDKSPHLLVEPAPGAVPLVVGLAPKAAGDPQLRDQGLIERVEYELNPFEISFGKYINES